MSEEKKRKPTGYSGRPWKYVSKEDLEKDIEAYFATCDKKGWPYTMSDLALALDMSRYTLINYGKDELFHSVVARARQRVEGCMERALYTAKGSGVQFALKNNFDWRDKSEREITGAGGEPLVSKIVIEYGDEK